MWFKNIKIYKFTDGFTLAMNEANDKLAEYPFRPCSSIEAMSQGFVPPNGKEGASLAYTANGITLMCLKKEEKVVPGSVVKEALETKIVPDRKPLIFQKSAFCFLFPWGFAKK